MKRKHIITVLCLILLAAAGGFGLDAYFDHQEEKEKLEAYARIIPYISLQPDDTFEEKVDKVRLFLFKHTEYSEAEDFHAIWENHPLIAQKLIDHATGKSNTPAPLECSARSNALENILINLGYDVRSITIHANVEDYDSHTFTEVRNPKTGAWHTQDVQFNIYWRMKEDGRRASIADLIQHDFDAYEPCRTPENCGWDLPNKEGSLAEGLKIYLGLASIRDYQRGKRPLHVNTARFDLSQPQKVGDKMLTYCDFRAKNCREQIIRY